MRKELIKDRIIESVERYYFFLKTLYPEIFMFKEQDKVFGIESFLWSGLGDQYF